MLKLFLGDPGQNGGTWTYNMQVKHACNFGNRANQTFEVFGKVKGNWRVAKSIRNIPEFSGGADTLQNLQK